MKRRVMYILLFSILFTAAIIVSVMLFPRSAVVINDSYVVNFRYSYLDKNIEGKIFDKNEIEELEKIIGGISYKDSPSCGFSENISLVFISNDMTLTVLPAIDGCSTMKIADENKYISITRQNRRKFDDIMKKYGFKFPAI